MSEAKGSRSAAWVAFVVALVMNLSNLFEPLTVDDVCHQYYAEQVSKDPLHPFEFDLVWHQKPIAAWDVMVAPVNSYYWAPGVMLFGGAKDGSTIGWKAWYLPVQFLFCWSLLALLRRVVPEHANWLLAMLALGPAVLPGINLMLEVPMLSLALSSLVVLLRACDRRSLGLALGAGVLWGLAFQTKYSAMGFFGPWLLIGALRGRWREFAVGFAAAAATALGIEGLVSLSHGGGSYFMKQLELTQHRDWWHNVRGMFSQVGMLGAPAAFLGLCALRAPKALRTLMAVLFFGSLLVIAAVPDADERSLADGAVDSIAYLVLSLATWTSIALVVSTLACRSFRHFRASKQLGVGRWRPLAVWSLGLALWVPSEIGASFVVSPFPAARRSMLVVIAFTFAVGWLAARRREAGACVRAVAGLSVVLGLVYQGVDLLEGRAVTRVASESVAVVHAREPNATIYFSGGWAFEFYAPRAGMKPFLRGAVEAKVGDYVVLGSIDGSEKPWFDMDSSAWRDRVEFVTTVEVGDSLPLSTQFHYYSGRRPLDGQVGPRFQAWVFRVKTPFHVRELPPAPDPWLPG